MSLNIKDEEARNTEAEMAEEQRKLKVAAKAEEMIAWVKSINGGKRRKGLTSDHSWLYDENGLPI